MSKFKVGDKLVCTNTGGNHLTVGKHYVAVTATPHNVVVINDIGDEVFYDKSRFEIVQEKEMFDMKTNPWFIRVNNKEEYDAASEWLNENFGNYYADTGYIGYIVGLSNTDDRGEIHPRVMWMGEDSLGATERYEVKLNFKTVIDSVEYPVVKSERDLKIEELEQSIKEAQERLNELKAMK